MAEAKNPTVDELEKKEEELFRTGPLSVLTTSVKSNSQVLINCRSVVPAQRAQAAPIAALATDRSPAAVSETPATGPCSQLSDAVSGSQFF